MYKFKFDTNKMTWNKAGLGANDFKLTGFHIKFTDEPYLKQCLQIIENITNNIFVLAIVKKNDPNKNSYILHNFKFTGYDFINQKFKSDIDISGFAISGMTHEDTGNFTSNINEWDLYILYK